MWCELNGESGDDGGRVHAVRSVSGKEGAMSTCSCSSGGGEGERDGAVDEGAPGKASVEANDGGARAMGLERGKMDRVALKKGAHTGLGLVATGEKTGVLGTRVRNVIRRIEVKLARVCTS